MVKDKRLIQNNLNTITGLKMMLHNEFYVNEGVILDLIEMIKNQFEIFNIGYNPLSKELQIKIKKTTMKKMSCYECTPNYYYTILNPIFLQFFKKHQNVLYDIFNRTGREYGIDQSSMNYLLDINYITSVYTIAIILDNIIIIKL